MGGFYREKESVVVVVVVVVVVYVCLLCCWSPGKKLIGRSHVRSVAEKRMTKLDDYIQVCVGLYC